MPALLNQAFQAVWAVSVHPGPLILDGHLHDDLRSTCMVVDALSTARHGRRVCRRLASVATTQPSDAVHVVHAVHDVSTMLASSALRQPICFQTPWQSSRLVKLQPNGGVELLADPSIAFRSTERASFDPAVATASTAQKCKTCNDNLHQTRSHCVAANHRSLERALVAL